MSAPKKGALHQLFVTLVDATDYAAIESAVTASQFTLGTRKFYGLNTGGSAATTSGAISKVASLVRSGVFRLTLKASENNYDHMQVRVAGITGCAEQIYEWTNVDNDDSDIMSALIALSAIASDAHSAAAQANSRVLVVQSFVSDIRSHVSDLQSDFQSRVPKLVATNSQLSDLASDVKSAVAIGNSRALVVQSLVSDVYSLASNINSLAVASPTASDVASKVWAQTAGAAAASRILLITSRVSDVQSQIAAGVPLDASTMSDLRSAITAGATGLDASALSDIASAVVAAIAAQGVALDASTMSDLRSAVAAVTASVSASDMSDIASRVDVLLASRLSDILSAAQQVNSRVLATQALVSNINSLAASSPTASTIASMVWEVEAGATVASRVLVLQSLVSDIRSQVSDLQSDFQSRVPKLVATNSQLSDLASDVKSTVAIGNSRVLIVQSMTSDLQSKLSDVESNLLSVLATTGVQLNASSLSDIRSAITAGATGLDASALSDIASAVVAAIAAQGVGLDASTMSDIRSAVLSLSGLLSDAHSAAAQGNSRALLLMSSVSDVQSAVAMALSAASDAHSAAAQGNSRLLVAQSYLSDIRSHVSDLQSDFQSRVPKLVATNSQLSDLHSDLKSALGAVEIGASSMSDLRSAITAGATGLDASALSDIASAVVAALGAQGVALDASTMSDLRSSILSLSALLSDAHSAAAQGNSRVLVALSTISDVASLLAAGVPLDASTMSDLRSAVLSLSGAISDAHSAAVQANSRALQAVSHASDIYSLLSDLHSDVGVLSGVVSDVYSHLQAGVLVGPSGLSDVASAVWARTGADPVTVVSPTGTMGAKVDWLTALARNKVTQTGTVQSLRNDADSADIASAAVADDGTTFIRGEWGN